KAKTGDQNEAKPADHILALTRDSAVIYHMGIELWPLHRDKDGGGHNHEKVLGIVEWRGKVLQPGNQIAPACVVKLIGKRKDRLDRKFRTLKAHRMARDRGEHDLVAATPQESTDLIHTGTDCLERAVIADSEQFLMIAAVVQ